MRNPKLVPYETIVRATSGEPEAVDEVLRHYSKRIRIAAIENGHIDRDTEDSIKSRYDMRFNTKNTCIQGKVLCGSRLFRRNRKYVVSYS